MWYFLVSALGLVFIGWVSHYLVAVMLGAVGAVKSLVEGVSGQQWLTEQNGYEQEGRAEGGWWKRAKPGPHQ